MEPEEGEDYRALEAAMKNDAAEIRRLRASGMEVNMGFEAGPYPMEAALELGHLDAFWALAEGADGEMLEFALCLAAGAGQGEVVDRLLGTGVPASAEDSVGTNALTYAVRGEGDRAGRIAIVRRLLAEGVDTKAAISMAAALRDGEMLDLLRDRAAPLNLTDAVATGDPRAVEVALASEAPNEKHIAMATAGGNAELLTLLLSRTAARPPLALNHAIAQGHVEVVRVMLANGWSVREGERVIHAARMGHAEVLRAILDAGGDPNESRDHGVSAVWEAVANNRLEALDVLLLAGADPNVVGFSGSPLHTALARNLPPEIIERLRTAGGRDLPPPPRP